MKVAILTSSAPLTDRPDMADTFVQATEVANCLRTLGHDTTQAAYGDNLRDILSVLDADVVFNLIEDVPEGPDQLHQATGLFDVRKLTYTGARTDALRILGNKLSMKAVLERVGLPVAPGLGQVGPDTPLIVKSAVEHSSVGLSVENVVTGAGAAMMLIARRQAEFGGEWFAEAYIDGREFNVAILDGQVLPVTEILFLAHDGRPKVVGYDEKWASGSAADEATPRVFLDDAQLTETLQKLALRAWEAFALTGYARVDFRVDIFGEPYILEVNANPCLSADAGFCAAAAKAGLTQTDVVAKLLAAAQD